MTGREVSAGSSVHWFTVSIDLGTFCALVYIWDTDSEFRSPNVD